MSKRARLWACLLVAPLLVACPEAEPELPPPPADLSAARALAQESLVAAEEALARDDRDAARAAAHRAAFADEQAGRLLGEVAEVSSDDRAARRETRGAARQAQAAFELLEELQHLAQARDGLKAKAYRKVRDVALRAAFQGLSLAAGEAETRGLDALPQAAQDSARLAADLAHRGTGRPKLADGEPDWAGIRADMQAYAQSPPWKLRACLGLGFLLLRKGGLAVIELESLDLAGVSDPEERLACLALRGFAYRLNGYPRLAARELERVAGAGAGESGGALGPELQAGVHLLLAAGAIEAHDLAVADHELARAIKAWPNNPVAVFLTGERQAANGEWEAAANSLERMAAGTRNEWLAERIATRARAIRDARGEAEPLLDDPVFLLRLALHHLSEAAGRSEAAARVQGWVESARAFGERLVPHLGASEDQAAGEGEPSPTPASD